jgi:hypothetical protein
MNCVNFWVFPQRLFYIGRRFGTLQQDYYDGPDRVFRKVGQYKTDAGETPKS